MIGRDALCGLSVLTCWALTGRRESWCSRAWRLSPDGRFVRIIDRLSPGHCRRSHDWHNPERTDS